MFYIYNKDKMVSVAIALSTILVLFCLAAIFKSKNNTIETSVAIQKEVPIYSVDTEENKVALTINCAWDATDMDSILNTLKENNVKATFFVVGNWVEKFPDAARKIYESGNEIANHSQSHPHVNNLNYEKNLEQIEKCSNLVKSITGSETLLYRGPYGEYNDTVIKAAKDSNHIMIQWSIDTLDYNGLSEEQMWEKIEEKLGSGSIILMHSGTENTALALDGIIKKIKEKGFELVTVSDLIYKENYSIDSNGIQHQN